MRVIRNYDKPQGAHTAAMRTPLYFAQVGQQSLDGALESDKPAPSVKVDEAWRRAFE